MEHVERLDEHESELRGDVDELGRKGDELERRGDEVDGQIGDAREDFESKQQTSDVPGAQERTEVTEAYVDDESEESHSSDADPRPGTSESPGGADEGGQATGNPPNDDSPAADDD